jgi:hypothetical protein
MRHASMAYNARRPQQRRSSIDRVVHKRHKKSQN